MKLTYYTDGGCEPNPGNGTWAFVCLDPYFECSGSQSATTNNRMEMMGVIKAFEHAIEIGGTDVKIFSDSQYVVKGFNEWMNNWHRNNWTKKAGYGVSVVKNSDLWKVLFEYKGQFSLEWVKGHNGNQFNELTDELVRKQYRTSFGGIMKY